MSSNHTTMEQHNTPLPSTHTYSSQTNAHIRHKHTTPHKRKLLLTYTPPHIYSSSHTPPPHTLLLLTHFSSHNPLRLLDLLVTMGKINRCLKCVFVLLNAVFGVRAPVLPLIHSSSNGTDVWVWWLSLFTSVYYKGV